MSIRSRIPTCSKMAGCSETLSCSKSLSHLGVLERSQLTLQFLGIDLSIRLLFSVGHVPPLVSVSPGLVRVTLYVSWGVYRCLQVQILVLRLSHRDPGVTVERHPAAPLAGMGKSIPSCQGEINRVFQPPPELRQGGIPSRGRKQGCFQPPGQMGLPGLAFRTWRSCGRADSAATIWWRCTPGGWNEDYEPAPYLVRGRAAPCAIANTRRERLLDDMPSVPPS